MYSLLTVDLYGPSFAALPSFTLARTQTSFFFFTTNLFFALTWCFVFACACICKCLPRSCVTLMLFSGFVIVSFCFVLFIHLLSWIFSHQVVVDAKLACIPCVFSGPHTAQRTHLRAHLLAPEDAHNQCVDCPRSLMLRHNTTTLTTLSQKKSFSFTINPPFTIFHVADSLGCDCYYDYEYYIYHAYEPTRCLCSYSLSSVQCFALPACCCS